MKIYYNTGKGFFYTSVQDVIDCATEEDFVDQYELTDDALQSILDNANPHEVIDLCDFVKRFKLRQITNPKFELNEINEIK